MHLTSSLLSADASITPTHWQASCFPELLRQKIHVIHDGIQTQKLTPNNNAWIRLGREGLVLRPGDEVVTFVNRNLEPMRGYHQFMRCLPELMARRPNTRVVIVGGDQVSYGAVPEGERGYKTMFLNEVKDCIDMNRLHFVNRVPYDTLVSLLRVSAAHVYLTVPFVLSWSMLEAMSLGALVIGSATAPVQEVIEHEKNGLLVDFFDPSALADTLCEVLARPKEFRPLRSAARDTVVSRYDFSSISLPAYRRLIEEGC
jgi:glycosyltransferase involved in cell wall biosynthesis